MSVYRSTFLLALILAACTQSTEQRSVDAIAEDRMVLIVKDMQLLESAHKDIPIYGKEKQTMMDSSYVMVLNKHGVGIDEWEESYAFYTADSERFSRLMGKVEEAIHQSR